MTKPLPKYKTVVGLLSNPKRWVKWAFALTSKRSQGHGVPVNSPKAQCFCLDGALIRVHGHSRAYTRARKRVGAAIAELFPELGSLSPITFNDRQETRHADVMKVVRRAKV